MVYKYENGKRWIKQDRRPFSQGERVFGVHTPSLEVIVTKDQNGGYFDGTFLSDGEHVTELAAGCYVRPPGESCDWIVDPDQSPCRGNIMRHQTGIIVLVQGVNQQSPKDQFVGTVLIATKSTLIGEYSTSWYLPNFEFHKDQTIVLAL